MSDAQAGRMAVAVLISSQDYLWNFYDAGAFEAIERDFDVRYVLVERTVSEAKAALYGMTVAGTVAHGAQRVKWLAFYLMLTMFRFARRVPGFRHKTHRMHPLKRVPYLMLSVGPIYAAVHGWMARFWSPWPELKEYLAAERPALLLVPSIAADVGTLDAINTARKLGVPCVALINSWDNLVSKGVMPIPPDIVAVWGEQGVEQAVDVQRIPRERIRVLGAPKMDRYFHESQAVSGEDIYRLNGIPEGKRIILYGSCALPFDDMGALKLLDDAIEGGRWPGHVVLFRPHPWMMHRVDERPFDEMGFRHTYFDCQMREVYDARFQTTGDAAKRDDIRQPEQDYYQKLMAVIKGIVCPLSTLVLEGAVNRRPSVLIAYGDEKNTFLPPNKMIEFGHIRDILGFPGIFVAKAAEELPARVDEMLAAADDANVTAALAEATRWIVFRDACTYAERLRDLVREAIG